MITLLWIFVHIFVLNMGLGLCLLSLLQNKHNRNMVETLVSATLLGVYIETIFIGTLIFMGLSLRISLLILICLTFVLIAFRIFIIFKKHEYIKLKVIKPLKWYEWILVISVLEKISFAIWQLTTTFVWAYDALSHWCGRGRCLYSGINWSLDPASPVFLGFTSDAKNYPLGVVIWRAITAELNGSWNDILARADNLLCFILLIASVWLIVYRVSKKRYLASIGAFIISALPFQVWNAASGYSDIAVETFTVAALASLLRKEWLLAGIFIAGSAWMKNDGLVIYGSFFTLSILLAKVGWKNIGLYLLGFFSLVPWLIFNHINELGFNAYGITQMGSLKIELNHNILKMFINFVVMEPTHYIFWFFILVSMVILSPTLWKDKNGKIILFIFFGIFLTLIGLYLGTNMIKFFVDGTGIHRSMLQFSGISVVAVMYGISMQLKYKDKSSTLNNFVDG